MTLKATDRMRFLVFLFLFIFTAPAQTLRAGVTGPSGLFFCVL
jgi:hypothetical protein